MTEDLNRRWYERSIGNAVKDMQKRIQHPIHKWMAATLDGRVEPSGAVFEAKFMLPWTFSEEAVAEMHMAQLQHNMWVILLKAAYDIRYNGISPTKTGGTASVPAPTGGSVSGWSKRSLNASKKSPRAILRQ